jgi:hypothetical protein
VQSDEAEVDMDELVRLLRQGPYDGLLHKILARWPRISADELDRAGRGGGADDPGRTRARRSTAASCLEAHPALDSLRPRPQ